MSGISNAIELDKFVFAKRITLNSQPKPETEKQNYVICDNKKYSVYSFLINQVYIHYKSSSNYNRAR